MESEHHEKFQITRVDNGYIIEGSDGDIAVCEDTPGNDVDSVANILRELLERLGCSYGKNSKQRIYISVLPGIDHPEYEKAVKDEFMIYS